MIGRVSFNANYDMTVRRIQDVTSRYHQALNIATTGKKVNSPYDDPGGYGRILAARTTSQQYRDYKSGTGLALQEMQLADSVLATANERLSRARELAVMGASEGYNAEDRASMAVEIAAVRDDLLMVGNTQFNGRYIFAGHQYDQPAYDDNGAYQGDAGVREYVAGEGYTLEVNLTGDEILGTAGGGVDVFSLLDDLETALNTDDTAAVQATLTDLDAALKQVNDARAVYGTRINQATELQALYEDQTLAITEQLSQEEDIDAAAAYTDVARLSTAMQATLQVSASVTRLSLLDFI